MFRESVLFNDDLIDRVSGTMVPVAMDVQRILSPESKEAQFLRPMIQPGGGQKISTGSVSGIWIFSSEGKVLGRPFVGVEDMVRKTEAILDGAAQVHGPVERRNTRPVETHPYRGKGFMPDGSVCLAEYVREGEPHTYSNIKCPVRSSAVLTREEFAAFSPSEATRGAEWDLPEAVAKRLCRVTSSMCYQHAPQPDWVTRVGIHARVSNIAGGVASLSYTGRISTRYIAGDFKKISKGVPGKGVISEQEMTLTGEGAYDLETGKMLSVLIVGTGAMRQDWKPNGTVAIHGLIEWVHDDPQESSTAGPRDE